jgi:ferredoxin-thioredoxin reductase catalytic chain
MSLENISTEEIQRRYLKLQQDAEAVGYCLNPDPDFTRALCGGLLTNEQRYGYGACPCRLPSGDAAKDKDICCPCDYRDADLSQFGTCF